MSGGALKVPIGDAWFVVGRSTTGFDPTRYRGVWNSTWVVAKGDLARHPVDHTLYEATVNASANTHGAGSAMSGTVWRLLGVFTPVFGTGAGMSAQGNDSRLLNNAKSVGGGREAVAALSATTGTATGDLSAASVFTVAPTGNITLAFSNVPVAGISCLATVIITQGATVRTVTMPSGTKWMGAAAPTQIANKVCLINMETVDGGSTWYATAAVEQ